MAEFVSLADLLRPCDASPSECEPAAPDAVSAVPVAGEPPRSSSVRDAAEGEVPADLAVALRDARLFRARLADAFDDARVRLVRELAVDVLARELRLAPCDLAAIARRVAARAPIVRVRVPAGLAASPAGIATVEDAKLAEGDAIVELTGGAVDARLGVRLAAVLEAFA